jgi:hypothetical protein
VTSISINPIYIPQLAYVSNGQPVLADLMFWSVTDGVNGQTYPAGALPTQIAGASGLTITAWYFPVGGGSGPTEIIDDAFSAVLGNFIDDTFVTVTSDPSLTSQANVVGIVPTTNPETLQAAASVASTTEPFSKWISFDAGTPSGNSNTISVPAKSTGMAIAVYERSGSTPVQPPRYGAEIVGFLIGGVAVDGGGSIVINGVPHPVDPWGPLVVQLVNASLITAGSAAFSTAVAGQGSKLAATAVVEAIRTALPQIEKEAGSAG